MADFGDFCIYIGGRGGFHFLTPQVFLPTYIWRIHLQWTLYISYWIIKRIGVTKSPIIISKDFHIIQCDVENLKGIENKNI
jgi:hypothetical protein